MAFGSSETSYYLGCQQFSKLWIFVVGLCFVWVFFFPLDNCQDVASCPFFFFFLKYFFAPGTESSARGTSGRSPGLHGHRDAPGHPGLPWPYTSQPQQQSACGEFQNSPLSPVAFSMHPQYSVLFFHLFFFFFPPFPFLNRAELAYHQGEGLSTEN